MKERVIDDRGASGLRRSPFNELTDSDIDSLKQDIQAIGADESVFRFNQGSRTGYVDELDIVNVRGDVFPTTDSTHPRDLMSPRAVLAHEYYGHRAYRNTPLPRQAWNDEFRASYMASVNAPNLSDLDRRYLVMDALERASAAGVTITHNNHIRSVLHGYNN